jgi:hypothetical protein
VARGDAELAEVNNWGTGFWGLHRGAGQNHLRKLLMKLYAELRTVEPGAVRDEAEASAVNAHSGRT